VAPPVTDFNVCIRSITLTTDIDKVVWGLLMATSRNERTVDEAGSGSAPYRVKVLAVASAVDKCCTMYITVIYLGQLSLPFLWGR